MSTILYTLALVLIGAGLTLLIAPQMVAWCVERYDAWRDPDGAHALARQKRKERAS